MNIKPIGNKILIKRDRDDYENTFTTYSGILVKQYNEARHKGRYAIGEIVSMGEYFHDKYGKLVNMGSVFKKGDKIIYYYPSQKIVNLDGLEYCFIRAEDVDLIVDSNTKIKLGV